MNKKYTEIPFNFNDFKNYLVVNKVEVIKCIFNSEKCFFYDTCSIQHHSNSKNRKYIIDYLKSKNATIILTRTVLMELSPNSFEVNEVQIEYFKELYNNGVKILLFDEEYVYDCLKEVFSKSNEELNLLLGYAVKEVSKHKGKVYQILEGMDTSLKVKIKGNNPGKLELFSRFFNEARSNKQEHDSLAEELIFICIIILTSIPYLADDIKYIFFSNDLATRSKVIQLVDYILKNHNKREPYQLTTATMVYKMHRESILNSKEEMIEIMSSTYGIGNANIYYVGEYDITQVNGKFTLEEIVDKIINDNGFKIMY
ncbi:transposase [Clostridium sp. MSJ-11]|uniref:Transposase n=1 Tax=Clostridium mobile TaxID=2841512 RepID=A0ABS6EL13_9CLOT|nr:transposase [Clostridium mobile]MBU5485743.1 transposase [Clostridium mobile]